ncbi:MAG: VWA domain-containing protein, partial [Deltaproteobacteria bacterium]|nr:VWA domain-containing protein [Deltaproteobacteria bacterium]
LAAGKSNSEKAELGGVFTRNATAPDPAHPEDDFSPAGSPDPPTFLWFDQGGGDANPLNDISLVFYDDTFETEVERVDGITGEEYTPTAAEWENIVGETFVNWVIEGKNTSTPETPGGALGRYWSNSRRIGNAGLVLVIDNSGSMVDEYAEIIPVFMDAITAVEEQLDGAPPPTIQIITFRNNVAVRITTTDFQEARDALSSITPNGGGTCPELGLQALQLAARNLAPTGSIIFASDASPHPGPSHQSIINEIIAKSGMLFTLLSGSCPTTEWGGSFAAPSSQVGSSREAVYFAPDDVDPPGGSIPDEGQKPLDAHGEMADAATPLAIGGTPVRGMTQGRVSQADSDFFVFSVEAGLPYRIRTVVHTASVNFRILAADGTTVLARWYGINPDEAPSTDVRDIPLVPTESGTLYLQAYRALGDEGYYLVSVDQSPLAEHFATYASIAAATGGMAVFPDIYGSFDTELTQVAIQSGVSSASFPAVVSANPREIPRYYFLTPTEGMILSVTLRGRRTHWNAESVVSFPAGDVTVLETEVVDPTTLRIVIQPDPATEPGTRDVQVSTPIDGGTELAVGRGVIELRHESFYQLLSFDPPSLARGASATVRVEGAKHQWSSDVSIDLGSGVVVDGVRLVAPNILEADVRVDRDAPFGYRILTVSDPPLADSTFDRATFIYADAYVPEPGSQLGLLVAILTLAALARGRSLRRG